MRTLEEMVNSQTQSIVYIDYEYNLYIVWGGTGRFNVYEKRGEDQYEETDTFLKEFPENMNPAQALGWAFATAQDYSAYAIQFD